MKAIRRFTVRTVLPEALAPLERLAANLRWAWHAPTREVFAAVDPAVWRDCGHDPFRMLGEVDRERFDRLARDEDFLARLRAADADLDTYLAEPRWYQEYAARRRAPAAVAYFSAEYGLTAALPQYSGGLGILAGDHLKSASDLGAPVIGVGLLYQHGYFTQALSPEGWQLEDYPEVDPRSLPLTQLRAGDGTPVDIVLDLPGGRRLSAHVWVVQVGRVPLLLLDAGHEGNPAEMRGVTDRLYGGGKEHRLRQELLLGVGGVRAVRAYCRVTGHPDPEVFHMNEGHAGFLGVERVREYISTGLSFAEAVEAARAGTVFTTHTPVPAGIDRFARDLVEAHFTDGDSVAAGVPSHEVMALGAEDFAGGDPGVFNMAVMGMRLAQRVNGVSRLHGAVSREMFQGLWPGFDTAEVPITSITNGVHARTWVAEEAQELAHRIVPDTGEFSGVEGWEKVTGAAEAELWEMRRTLRRRLVDDARERLRASWRRRGASEAELGWVDDVLDPDVLTIGFARRVPSYKRLTLMLRDRERLASLLLDPDRPLQIVIAGKAHPADEGGKRLIQEIVRFTDDPRVRHRIVFLPDYDMDLARSLVQGCDVWLNNPLRPLEACGTSGMKAALNGGLNLSVRDGWWDEWYDGSNGWAIPTADGVEDPDRRDALEAAALYDLIEQQVVPLFYDHDDAGLPKRWLEMVKHTLVSLGPKVLATRMVQDYVTLLYQGAADSSRLLGAEDMRGARDLAAWKHRVRGAWPGVRVEHVEVMGMEGPPLVGRALEVRASVALNGLDPADVRVEVAIGRVSDSEQLVDPEFAELAPDPAAPANGGPGAVRFTGAVPLERAGNCGFTVRALPRHPLLSDRAELGLVALPEAPGTSADGMVLR
ncbi:alpha-glucan family phosphorylase [Streptomonospora nanhaiensis]|uniref:alpha-glucan family phosphorylase n=1 Tax=Streptomonospora nanhaiensis TaxID=1323731 RepID=UPI001C39351E|nr:alpha-glucan family phosphorylase [Streptomonospora nanhaiensis]MBV2365901.1 alpha-glucan family phosphorylase [Streptomonospora nanhaiensis]MBX9389012.1 alpha-glucan family phosphorylase [Streptomonospora nanhaiensis]